MDLFKQLGMDGNTMDLLNDLMPERIITITANLKGNKKKQHSFIGGTSTNEIQLFLTKLYGPDCWSYE